MIQFDVRICFESVQHRTQSESPKKLPGWPGASTTTTCMAEKTEKHPGASRDHWGRKTQHVFVLHVTRLFCEVWGVVLGEGVEEIFKNWFLYSWFDWYSLSSLVYMVFLRLFGFWVVGRLVGWLLCGQSDCWLASSLVGLAFPFVLSLLCFLLLSVICVSFCYFFFHSLLPSLKLT